jgi:nickel/cobalt transporter (NicO) family protein
MKRALIVLGGCVLLALAGAGIASAHPLGNFSVNHYDGLTLYPDRVELRAVVDTAEIPTVQDGQVPPGERSGTGTVAAGRCADLAAAVSVSVRAQPVRWTLDSATLAYPPGQAGLATTRLECELSAPAELDRAAEVAITDSLLPHHTGWREITATGSGVRLLDSPLPSASVSDELRSYPNDLLSSPLDVRAATLRVTPGSGGGPAEAGTPPASTGPLDRITGTLTHLFTSTAGARDLTPVVGLLAVLLSLVLGASHALLPGHGKTVMAAYLAGRRGSVRDAMLVGATVTATHTAGVLVLGLVVTVTSAVAGEGALRLLGVISGLLVAIIGAGLLRTAWRALRPMPADTKLPALAHTHTHPHDHPHHHPHDHDHDGAHGHDQDGAHGHDRAHSRHHEHNHRHGYRHKLGHHHHHHHGRAGLIGLGVAGGLVPSPSALVVLLGAIALGRTWFGVLLVLGYGLGMAATLTAAGILLVRLRHRLEQLNIKRRAARLNALLPLGTATLVLVVGLGMAARAAIPV